MCSKERVHLTCGIIVLVVTDILLWGSISYVHTIVGFNMFLGLSTGLPMILPLRIMTIILDDLCFAKYILIVYFVPSIAKEMSHFGGEVMSLQMVDIQLAMVL